MEFCPPTPQVESDDICIACLSCGFNEFVVMVADVPLAPRVSALVCAQCEIEIRLVDGRFYQQAAGNA